MSSATKVPLLSDGAITALLCLAKGGSFLAAGVTGQRWVVFRHGEVVSPVYPPEVAHELEHHGLLTARGRQLSRSHRARQLLERLRIA